MRIQYSDMMFAARLAWACKAIVFWHETSTGDYQMFLLPVSAKTWKQIGNG